MVALAAVAGVILGLLAAMEAADATGPVPDGPALLAEGRAALDRDDMTAADAAFAKAAALGDAAADPVLKGEAFLGLSEVAARIGNDGAVRRFLAEARDLFAGAGAVAREADALLAAGDFELSRHPQEPRALETAMGHYLAARQLGLAHGDDRILALALMHHGAAMGRTDDIDGGRAATEQARDLFEQANDRRNAALAVRQLARLSLDAGDLAAGRAGIEEEALLWRRLGDEAELVAALNMLAWLRMEDRAFDGAEALLQETDAIARRLADPFLMAETERQQGGLAERRGRRELACSHFAAATELYRAVDAVDYAAQTEGYLRALDCPERHAGATPPR